MAHFHVNRANNEGPSVTKQQKYLRQITFNGIYLLSNVFLNFFTEDTEKSTNPLECFNTLHRFVVEKLIFKYFVVIFASCS